MKARWRVTPITPTGADVCRYFSSPTPIHVIDEGRRRVATFVVRNKISRFVYTIDTKNPVNGQWQKGEHSNHDNRNLSPIIRDILEKEAEEQANE